jgi:hypothetical protein
MDGADLVKKVERMTRVVIDAVEERQEDVCNEVRDVLGIADDDDVSFDEVFFDEIDEAAAIVARRRLSASLMPQASP